MFLLLFDFYCFINVKFCVADRFDFIDNFNAAFSAYANTGAGRNYVFKAWVARISDRCSMFAFSAFRGIGNVVCGCK